jgi:hypothetical protein
MFYNHQYGCPCTHVQLHSQLRFLLPHILVSCSYFVSKINSWYSSTFLSRCQSWEAPATIFHRERPWISVKMSAVLVVKLKSSSVKLGNAPDLDVWVAARSKVRWWRVWKKTIQEYRYMVIRAGGNTLQNSTLDQNFSSNSSNTQPGLGAPVTGQQPTRARTLIITRQPQVVLPIARRISWRKWQLSQQLATPASMSYAAAQQPGGVVPICRHGMFLVALETVKFHSC